MNLMERCKVCGGSGLDGRFETVEEDGSRHGTYASCGRCLGDGHEPPVDSPRFPNLEQQRAWHRGDNVYGTRVQRIKRWATQGHPYYSVIKVDGERLYPRQAPWFAVWRLLNKYARRGWFRLRYQPGHFIRSEEGFDGWLYVEAKRRFRR